MTMPPHPAPDEERPQAPDDILTPAELASLYRGAGAARAREARRRALANCGRVSLLVALAGACIAQAAALAALLPTVRVEPVFVYLREDGTATSSLAWKDMPADLREANILNVIAEYVRLREGWSAGEAGHAWDVVSALSAKAVRDEFQAWYRQDNRESPQRLYGETATVRVVVTDARRDPTVPGAWRVYFTRAVQAGGAAARPVPMVAALRLRDAANPRLIPWYQRVQFNGPAIVVVEYPGAVPVGPAGESAR
ncbi:VirB8 domain-containing protein (plasmid) [Rhodovastum atsumiense]|nr:VirB8/TrbF family protein [Rhodovastum atsumiense]CAH2606363.1 VirB8 domain-containing protein [Rhodovastum atsumiense]